MIGQVYLYRGRREQRLLVTYLQTSEDASIRILGTLDDYGQHITLTEDERAEALEYAAEQIEDERLVDCGRST